MILVEKTLFIKVFWLVKFKLSSELLTGTWSREGGGGRQRRSLEIYIISIQQSPNSCVERKQALDKGKKYECCLVPGTHFLKEI